MSKAPQPFKPIRYLPIADLIRDPEYQRNHNRIRARKIADDFNTAAFDPPTVAERSDGKFVVVDGATRICAAEMVGYAKVPCTSCGVLTLEEEAKLFGQKNDGQKRLNPIERYHAAISAKDPQAIEIQAALLKTGWTTPPPSFPSATSVAPRGPVDLKCIGEVQKGQRNFGTPVVRRALTVLRSAVPLGETAEAWMVGGTSTLIGYYPELKDTRLAQILGTNWDEVKRQMRARGELGSGNRASTAAVVMRHFYNKDLRANKLNEDLL